MIKPFVWPHHFLRYALSLGFGILLLQWLLNQVSTNQVLDILARVEPIWLALAVLAGLVATMLRALRYRQFFGATQSRLRLYGVFAFGRGIVSALPFRTGELVMLGLLKRNGLSPPMAETAPVWLFLRMTDIAVLTVLASLTVLFSSDDPLLRHGVAWFALVTIVGLGLLALIGWWTTPDRKSTCESWFMSRLQSFRNGFSHMRDSRRVGRAFVYAGLIWIAMMVLVATAQLAFGSPLSLAHCLGVGLTVLFLSTLPIHGPLNLGTADASWAGCMMLAGMQASQAVALALCVRLVMLGILLLETSIGLLILSLLCSGDRAAVVLNEPQAHTS